MPQPLTGGSSPAGAQPRSSSVRSTGLSLRMSTVLFAIMTVAFIVSIIFAANSSSLVGWLVVIVAGGWLAIFAFLVFTFRRAAKKAGAAIDQASRDISRTRSSMAPVSGMSVVNERDSLLDEKLDHSFKIIEVQKRVIAEERAKGEAGSQDMIDRALETIEITASNARDMLRPDRHASRPAQSGSTGGHSGGDGETITGTVL